MRIRHGLLASAAVLFAAVPSGASAQEISGLKATQVFAIADQALAANKPEDALTMYRALTRDPDVEVRSEARFRLGMLLSRLGRNREGAVEFPALLDEKPDAARFRLDLARVPALIAEDPAARRELRQAQAGGLPPEVG